jgi:hypothetical protein
MFLFTEKYGDSKGVTVHFLENKKIIIKRTEDYKSFKTITLGIDLNGTEESYEKSEIWIIYENGIDI